MSPVYVQPSSSAAQLVASLYFVYDAFDTSDVQQGFTHRKLRLAGQTAPWLRAQSNSAVPAGNAMIMICSPGSQAH